ncbi:MAG TPA: hypothetical protein VMV06_06930 [Acidimicrobiales bacterium]|nr:hypothetical protein [Acidimicrobiales bacterium]
MSERAGPGTPAPPRATVRNRWLPFWVLQVTELVVALVFVDVSVHVSNAGLLVAAAATFAALAVTARGPLGIVRICGERLHLVLVMAAAGIMAVGPVIPALRPDIEGIIVLEFGAIGLMRLATFTRLSDTARSVSPSRRGSAFIDARATVVVPGATPEPPPAPAPEPPSSGSPGHRSSGVAPGGATARWLGRTAGIAAASGRRAAARHRPVAGARIRRSIRSAGRLTGRVTSRPDGPEDPAR